NAAPREDITRVQVGGVRYQISVDISATRRVDVALRHMALASLMKSFNNKKPLSECIADEIIAAANNDAQNSFAVRKKDEIERMAKAAR
ncbi:MAG: 30S ribosomal protein S7, partial [Candidatus Anstonellales archaeon]